MRAVGEAPSARKAEVAMNEAKTAADLPWQALSYEEKNHLLYLRQKNLLDLFLERGAITQAQHDKSLRDLREKTGESA